MPLFQDAVLQQRLAHVASPRIQMPSVVRRSWIDQDVQTVHAETPGRSKEERRGGKRTDEHIGGEGRNSCIVQTVSLCECVCDRPAAVGVAAQQNLSTSTANGAVGLVTVVIVHVGHLQVHVLKKYLLTRRHTSGFSETL